METVKKQIKTAKQKQIVQKKESIQLFFWNLNGKDLSQQVVDVITAQEFPRILIFAETTQSTRKALNQALSPLNYVPRTQLGGDVRVAVFDKLEDKCLLDYSEEQLFTHLMYEIEGKKFLVVGVHFYSPVSYPDPDDRFILARTEALKIENLEKHFGIDKTILIGDFNLNPFDKGIVSSLSLQATHCKRTSKNGVKGKKRYFFNPSWHAFSNDSMRGKPPGTIYYVPINKESYVHYWNLFDQVLIRPELFSKFADSYEIIISGQRIKSLLDENFVPDRNKFSDHLPIKYIIEI